MVKKILLIALPIIIILFFIGYYFLFYIDAQNIGTSVFKAISLDASAILKINNPERTIERENDEHYIYKSLKANLFENIDTSIVLENISNVETIVEIVSQITNNKPITVQFNFKNESQIEVQFFVALESVKDSKSFFRNLEKNKDVDFEHMKSRKFSGSTIYECTIRQNEQHQLAISFAFHKGLFITSGTSNLVEKAILQLNSPSSIENDDGFAKVNKTASKESEINIFINHKNSRPFLTSSKSSPSDLFPYRFSNFAKWSVLDLNFRHGKMFLSGFSSSDVNFNETEQLFRNQTPQKITIDSLIPSKSLCFRAISISDVKKFQSDLAQFEKNSTSNSIRESELKSIQETLQFNISQFFTTYFDNEMAYIDLFAEKQISKVWLVKVNDTDRATNDLRLLQQNQFKQSKLKDEVQYSTFKIDNETEFNIYKSPINTLSQLIFGSIIPGFNSLYISSYKNCLVFSDSKKGLEQFLHANVIGETLTNEQKYNRFASNFSMNSNFLLYKNSSFHNDINNSNTDTSAYKAQQIELNLIGWNFSTTNGMIYHDVQLQFDSTPSIPIFKGWKTFIDTIPIISIQPVVNTESKSDNDICIQDQNNNLSLINSSGRIIFKIAIDKKILGGISQLDYFRDGKLQLTFNTEDQIYIIDRNGKNIGKSPYKLLNKATNGLSIFDYENNKDYRIFIACQNNTIYAYSKDGKLVNGWNPFVAKNTITHPIQFFRIDKKDYIVFKDDSKIYMLDRKGNERVVFADNYNFSTKNTLLFEPRSSNNPARLVTTDKNGLLLYFSFTGKKEMKKFGKYSENHNFSACNFDNDGDIDYLFSDLNSIEILNSNGKRLLQIADSTFGSSVPITYISKNRGCTVSVLDKKGLVHFINIDKQFLSSTPINTSKINICFTQGLQPGYHLFSATTDGFLINNLLP